MKNIIYIIGLLAIWSCSPEDASEIEIGPAPSVSFTVTPDSSNPNRIILSNTSQNGDLASWTYSGSESGFITAKTDTAYFPIEGDYIVKLTVAGKGGTASLEQTVNVPQTDPDGVDPVVLLLTGGVKDGSKAWVWNTAAASFGVGPSINSAFDPTDPEDQSWFSGGESVHGGCVYDDEYVFSLDNEQTFLNNDNGDIRWGWAWANEELGTNQGEFADGCFESTQPDNAKWSVEKRMGSDDKEYSYLVLTEGGNLGYYEGRSEYHILSITETELVLRSPFGDPGAGDNGWRYFKYLAK